MRIRFGLASLLPLALLVATAVAHAQGREEARLLTARQVIEELRATPDQFVPDRLLSRAYGIAVVPDVTKAAFFFGGARGNGVLVVRRNDGHFSDPIFINLTGGSVGFQWGIQSTDVVLVFTSQRSIERITSGKLTLGADASVAAGPVGRQASAATDPTISSEVYSYSRSRGLFLGIALSGSAITIDDGADARFYNRGVAPASEIASGALRSSDDIARRFLAAIDVATGMNVPRSASAAPVGQPTSTPEAPSGAPAQGATTFPLADPHPGAEPTAH